MSSVGSKGGWLPSSHPRMRAEGAGELESVSCGRDMLDQTLRRRSHGSRTCGRGGGEVESIDGVESGDEASPRATA